MKKTSTINIKTMVIAAVAATGLVLACAVSALRISLTPDPVADPDLSLGHTDRNHYTPDGSNTHSPWGVGVAPM